MLLFFFLSRNVSGYHVALLVAFDNDNILIIFYWIVMRTGDLKKNCWHLIFTLNYANTYAV